MKRRGPCVASPYLLEEKKDWASLERTPPDRLSNPWPQLAGVDDLRTAYSQPLMRLLYYPILTHIPGSSRVHPKGREDYHHILNTFLIGAHELLHLCLDLTPARELARICLADAHLQVHELLFRQLGPWDQSCSRSFDRLIELNTFLARWAEDVSLAEELLATAVAFHVVDAEAARRDLPDEFLALMTHVELDWIAAQSHSLSVYFADRGEPFGTHEFDDLYIAFRRILLLLTGQAQLPFPTAIARLGAYLEPTRYAEERDNIELVSSRDRCHEVAEAVSRLDTGDHMVAWLDRAVRDSPDWRAWEVTLALSERYQQGGPYEHPLWAVTRDSTARDARRWGKWSPAERRQAAWTWPGPKKRWSYTVLSPIEVSGRWYINASLSGVYRRNYDSFLLLLLESVRQQIDVGYGIRCPAVDPRGVCTCAAQHGELKEGLLQLAQWGLDGRFGPGEWTGLAYPCVS